MPKDIRLELLGVAGVVAVVAASVLLLLLPHLPVWLRVAAPLFLCWSLFMRAEIELDPEDFCA